MTRDFRESDETEADPNFEPVTTPNSVVLECPECDATVLVDVTFGAETPPVYCGCGGFPQMNPRGDDE